MPELKFGGGISDWKFKESPPKRSEIPSVWDNLIEQLGSEGIEIQIGFMSPPRKLPIKGNHAFIGFHQPGERIKEKEIHPRVIRPLIKTLVNKADILSTMNLAQKANADYFVIHPYEIDKEGVSQEEKREKAIKFIKEISGIKKRLGHKYRLCIENLNEPGYPTSTDGTIELLNMFKSEEIGLVIDIDHHWYGYQQKKKGGINSPDGYYDQLTKDLSTIIERCGANAIEGFHIAQAYHVNGEKKWEMHGLPGLLKGQKMTNATPLLFSAPEGFNGEWLNIGKVLSIIRLQVQKHAISDVKILIEANSEESEIAENIKQLEKIKE